MVNPKHGVMASLNTRCEMLLNTKKRILTRQIDSTQISWVKQALYNLVLCSDSTGESEDKHVTSEQK